MNRTFHLFLLSAGLIGLISCANMESNAVPPTQFSVIGNVGAKANVSRVEVHQRYYNEEGMPEIKTLVSALVADGWFEIIGEIDSPTMVKIVTKAPSEEDGEQVRDSAIAVIEPGARLVLTHFGPFVGNYVNGTGTHAELVSSWQFSEEYVNARNRYGYLLEARVDRETRIEAAKKTASDPEDEGEDSEFADTDGAAESSKPDIETLDEERKQFVERAWDTYQEMDRIRKNTLTEISKSDDPYKALLAIELMEHLGTSDETLARLEELTKLVDSDTVASRVTPKKDRLVMLLERNQNDKGLETGVVAPDFTAPDLAGEDVNLYGLIADKKVVLLDFWASWCGPCIKTFPKLKELYAEYNEQGFEIVMVSIDDNDEEWVEASEEHNLIWPSLGDINDDVGPVAMAYGVSAIPKGFVLDHTGKIVARDLNTDRLEEFLEQQFSDSSDS